MKTHTTHQLLSKIATLQDVQRINPPDSEQWKAASVQLEPLFKEMAKHQQTRQRELLAAVDRMRATDKEKAAIREAVKRGDRNTMFAVNGFMKREGGTS